MRSNACRWIGALAIGTRFMVGFCQVQSPGRYPVSSFEKVNRLTPRAKLLLPPMNNDEILSRAIIEQEQMGLTKSFKFAESVPFELDSRLGGEWAFNEEGTARIWRAVVSSPGALSLSLSFSDFHLPQGGEFYVISTNVLGQFILIML